MLLISALAATGRPLTVAPSGVVQIVSADATPAHMMHAAAASAEIPFFGTTILPSPFQLKAIACVSACVVTLMLVCDDNASRMRREALGYSRLSQKQFPFVTVFQRELGNQWALR